MTDARPSKVTRALGALRPDAWSELSHRRVAKRLEVTLASSKRSRRPWAWSAAGALALAASVMLWLVLRTAAPQPESTSALAVGSEREPARALLSDGSVIDIDRGGRVRVLRDQAEHTQIEVLAGRAEFEVEKRHGRPFVALIRGVEVRVIGTHFSTELDLARPPGLVRIKVQRGTVEVAAPHGERVARLGAGDSLEVSLTPERPAGPRSDENAPSSSKSTNPEGEPAESVGGIGSVAAPVVAAPVLEPSKLFQAANDARRSGNVRGAVKAYATLLDQFPRDERAGVAALELGRLRMDSLHAYAPAAQAFRRAIAAAPNDGIREDALARLVEVLDRMHDLPGCLAEQRRYRARYPLGVHSSSVERRCTTLAH